MAFQRRNFGGFKPRRQSGGNRSNHSRNFRTSGKIRYMNVDPRMLIKKAELKPSEEYVPLNTFENLKLNQTLLENVKRKGYSSPSPIQDQVIPVLMQGKDVIGLAATGTGKTAAFLLPILHKIMNNPHERALIIAPTRELAVQIVEEGRSFASGSNVRFALIIGGVEMKRQINELRRKPNIVVGTPGRLKDLNNQRELSLTDYSTIVLDEVDRMLDMGFVRDITFLINQMPKVRHSLFFSATLSDVAREVAKKFLNNPATIQIATQRASDRVDQDIVRLAGRNKIEVLHELLIRPGFERVLVFGRTKHGMERLSNTLADRGFATASIHGNKSQNQRQRALRAFKNGEVKVLLATDVAARGIDVNNVTHVINYELPETYDDYIHRIGRTGRADRMGVALTFID